MTADQKQITLKTFREWLPALVMVIGFIVWMVEGHTTAVAVTRDLHELKVTAAQEREKLLVAFKDLAVEVRRISVQQAEARAERKALRRSLDRVEARCCGSR